MKTCALLIFYSAFCSYSFSQIPDPSATLTLPQHKFDSDTCCWRKLAKAGKYQEAAQLVIEYLSMHKKQANKHSLNWHAGQLLAMAGDTKLAKKYSRKTYWIGYKWFGGEDARAWFFYAKGTIFFLDNNKPALQKILQKWQQQGGMDENYNALHRLLANWGKPYREAY